MTPSPQPYIPWVYPPEPTKTLDDIKITIRPKQEPISPVGWLVVGHCHDCGNPIYAKVGDTSVPPKSHRTCECK
jgi:hypothetical protein